MTLRTALIAALAACVWMAAPQQVTRAQSLGGAREFVWPEELTGSLSCRRIIEARERYMSQPRPAFNCIRGVDCPQDLAPAPPAEPVRFIVYYDYVDTRRRQLEVTLPEFSSDAMRTAVQHVLGDLDRVARSRSKTILVTGHTDTSDNAARSLDISQTIGQCVSNAVDIGLHLNGYRGAYDFQMTIESRGESDPNVPTPDGVREPLNRRAMITIMY